MIKRLGLVCLLLIGLSNNKLNAETLIIAAENGWVPYAQEDGTGMANDIIKLAFAQVGIDVKFHVYPYARVLHYLKSGRYVAGFNVPFDETANRDYLLGDTPMYYAESAYYHHLKRPLPISKREALNDDEIIGVVRDYGYGDYYLDLVDKEKIIPVISNHEVNNVELLTLGRIDATILYTKTANYYRKNKIMGNNIVKAFSNEKTAIHLAFSREHKQAQRYLALFERGLKQIIKNGKRDKIIENY